MILMYTYKNILALFSRRKKPQLSVVAVQTTNIPPKENVTYSKNTQTLESGKFQYEFEEILIDDTFMTNTYKLLCLTVNSFCNCTL